MPGNARQESVYLDAHATTPLDPGVLEAMGRAFLEFGNPSSQHPWGESARLLIEQAREQVASLIGARAREIIFTSGATESDNLALKGLVEAFGGSSPHIVTCVTEHKAVLDTVRWLSTKGAATTLLPVDTLGRVSLEALHDAITPQTAVVSVMAGNNEVGTLHPVHEVGRITKERDIVFHCDAAQAVGKIPLSVEEAGVDLLSMSAHKLNGPKGVGALFVRRGVQLGPQIHGGGQERAVRSGTLNVPGIVGLGAACAIAEASLTDEATRIARLRDLLQKLLVDSLPDVKVNGDQARRLPGNLNLTIGRVDSDALIARLPDVALSASSACTELAPEPSHVLLALGLTTDEAHSSVRFGVGRFTSEQDVHFAASRVIEEVQTIREIQDYPRVAPRHQLRR